MFKTPVSLSLSRSRSLSFDCMRAVSRVHVSRSRSLARSRASDSRVRPPPARDRAGEGLFGSGSAAATAAPAGFSAARPTASAATTVEHAGALSRAAESRWSLRLLLIRAAGNTACAATTGALPCAAACSTLRFLLIREAGPALTSLFSPPPATTAPESRFEREDREARRSFDCLAADSLPPLPSPAVPLLRFLLIRGEGGAPTLLSPPWIAPPAPFCGREKHADHLRSIRGHCWRACRGCCRPSCPSASAALSDAQLVS